MQLDVLDYTAGWRNPDVPSARDATERRREPHHIELISRAGPSQSRELVLVMPTDTLESVVARIINLCRARDKLELLRIHGHGSPGWFLHGEMTTRSVRAKAPVLRSMAPFFEDGAQAHLMGCNLADEGGQQMLIDLAGFWGVAVTGGVGKQISRFPIEFFEGGTLTAFPGADFTERDMQGIPLRDLPPRNQ